MRLPLILLGAAAALGIVAIILAVAPSSSEGAVQGDTDCSGEVDTIDVLISLLLAAGGEPEAECADVSGDVNCDEIIDPADVLALLLHISGLTPPQPAGAECPAIGEQLPTPTPSATADASPSPGTTSTATTSSSETGSATATATATPGASPSGPTPMQDRYVLAELIAEDELGPAAMDKVELALIPGAPGEAVIALQSGEIYRVSLDGSFAPTLWGDVSSLVDYDDSEPEQGLLSLAFSPDFESDGLVYLYYTPGAPEPTVVARFEATVEALDEGSHETVITTPAGWQPVHNGGRLVFGPQGNLLLSLGDGGFGQDAMEGAQELDVLLGKLIRIDVSVEPYAIPADNPFVGEPGVMEEIYAFGFRNPWRYSVDSLTGEIWLGDVGEGTWEEVNHVVPGGNYGWDCREGPDEFEVDEQCDGKVFIEPRVAYGRDEGIAVTGGYVYRGSALPELYGWFVYADYATGTVWAVNTEDDSPPVRLADGNFFITSFAELPNGELLIISYRQGVYQLAHEMN